MLIHDLISIGINLIMVNKRGLLFCYKIWSLTLVCPSLGDKSISNYGTKTQGEFWPLMSLLRSFQLVVFPPITMQNPNPRKAMKSMTSSSTWLCWVEVRWECLVKGSGGAVVTMHMGACETRSQILRPLGRGIWRAYCSHKPAFHFDPWMMTRDVVLVTRLLKPLTSPSLHTILLATGHM